mgnify:CR=1 FL=1
MDAVVEALIVGVDADMVCLAPFAFEGDHVFASERAGKLQNPTCSAMATPDPAA